MKTLALALALTLSPASIAWAAKPTVVVVPFQNKSSVEYSWMGHGAAEVMSLQLIANSTANAIPISALNAVLRKRDLTADAVREGPRAADVGATLGADLIIGGSVSASWPDVEVSAWVLDA